MSGSGSSLFRSITWSFFVKKWKNVYRVIALYRLGSSFRQTPSPERILAMHIRTLKGGYTKTLKCMETTLMFILFYT